MIKMNFNNVDFSRWLVITKGFTTFGGADFDVTTKDVGFTFHIVLDKLQPGKKYKYNVFIDNKISTLRLSMIKTIFC